MTPSDDRSVAMNFTWIEDGLLAGCREPRTDDDFGFLVSKRIKLLVRLAHEEETGISPRDVTANGYSNSTAWGCYAPAFVPPPRWCRCARICASAQGQLTKFDGNILFSSVWRSMRERNDSCCLEDAFESKLGSNFAFADELSLVRF